MQASISNRPINARGIVIFSQVRLQTLRPELGEATARAIVSAFVITDRLEAAVTQKQHKPWNIMKNVKDQIAPKNDIC